MAFLAALSAFSIFAGHSCLLCDEYFPHLEHFLDEFSFLLPPCFVGVLEWMLPPSFFLLNKCCTWNDSPSSDIDCSCCLELPKPFQLTSTFLMSVLWLLEIFLSDFVVSLLWWLDPWSFFLPVYRSCTFLLAFWVPQRTLQLILTPLFSSSPFLKQSCQILFEKLKQDWCFTITISISN